MGPLLGPFFGPIFGPLYNVLSTAGGQKWVHFLSPFLGTLFATKGGFVLRWCGRLVLATLLLWVRCLPLAPMVSRRSRRLGSSRVPFCQSHCARVRCKRLRRACAGASCPQRLCSIREFHVALCGKPAPCALQVRGGSAVCIGDSPNPRGQGPPQWFTACGEVCVWRHVVCVDIIHILFCASVCVHMNVHICIYTCTVLSDVCNARVLNRIRCIGFCAHARKPCKPSTPKQPGGQTDHDACPFCRRQTLAAPAGAQPAAKERSLFSLGVPCDA